MTTHTASADPVAMDAAFDSKRAKSAKSDNNAMMAGADMYRRMQAKPKSPATGYLIYWNGSGIMGGLPSGFASFQIYKADGH